MYIYIYIYIYIYTYIHACMHTYTYISPPRVKPSLRRRRRPREPTRFPNQSSSSRLSTSLPPADSFRCALQDPSGPVFTNWSVVNLTHSVPRPVEFPSFEYLTAAFPLLSVCPSGPFGPPSD